VNDLLSTAYNEEYMACHSLGGTSSKESSKAGLPAEDVVNLLVDLHFVDLLYVNERPLTYRRVVGWASRRASGQQILSDDVL